MEVIYKGPNNLRNFNWCPGCGHGIFVRLVEEVLEEKGLVENNVCIVGVGCSANIHAAVVGGNKVEAHHGRAPATARGMKAVLSDALIWTYQGDGDAYAIGMGETMLAALNGYPITTFVINNFNYGMTGGQSGPTTLPGQITTTAPLGSTTTPFNSMAFISAMDNAAFVARGTTASVAEIAKLKKYISRAIDEQMLYHRYAFVEVLCTCPTNWHMTPVDAADHILTEAVKHFPLGVFKDKEVPRHEL